MESKWKYDDPLEEIYAIRRKISAQYGHDIRRIAEAAKEWRRDNLPLLGLQKKDYRAVFRVTPSP